jgi:uncharacterized repeat protein (TIGR02543 family)
MKKVLKNPSVLFGLALIVPLVSACGGGKGNSTETASSNPTSSSSASSLVAASSSISALTVTFDYNYTGAPTAQAVQVSSGTSVAKPSDPTRANYLFKGWCTDSAGTTSYDFAALVESSFTLYASWEALQSGANVVTFSYNYEGGGAYLTLQIEANRKVTRPTNPTRESYYFMDWYSDASCTTLYDFDTRVTSSFTIYAKWLFLNTFEGEYTDFTDKNGQGYSGTCSETQMIQKDTKNAGASNGFYVGWLYYNGAFLEFDITAEKALTDVIFIARLSAEFFDIASLDASNYGIYVNGTEITGYSCALTGAYDVSSSKLRPFNDFTISKSVSLKQGENVIKLVTENNTDHGGTLHAASPLIDCIKLGTEGTLTWNPLTDNIKGI